MILYFIILGGVITIVSWVIFMRDMYKKRNENMVIVLLAYIGMGMLFSGIFYDMTNNISLNDLIGSYIRFPRYLRTIFLSIGIFLLFIAFVSILKQKYIDTVAIPSSYIGLFLFITFFYI